jgi:hypothetical protein
MWQSEVLADRPAAIAVHLELAYCGSLPSC